MNYRDGPCASKPKGLPEGHQMSHMAGYTTAKPRQCPAKPGVMHADKTDIIPYSRDVRYLSVSTTGLLSRFTLPLIIA
jgi:hypothetical protein